MRTAQSIAQLESDIDGLLDDDLQEIAGPLDAAKRIKWANTFARWSQQLEESAYKMNPNLKKTVRPQKVPKGFFLVNLAHWEQKEMRALARQCGMELRCLIDWGVRQAKAELQEKLKMATQFGVKPQECWKIIKSNPQN